MKVDHQGLSVTTSSDAAIDVINTFTQELISNGKHVDVIIEAAEQYQDCYLILCYAAGLNLFAQEPVNYTSAKQLLNIASELDCNEREQQYYLAFRAWIDFDYQKAIDHLVEITATHPKDCAAAKFAEWLFYLTGQKHQAEHFLAMCEHMYSHNKHNPYFLSSYAFSLELSGKFEQAIKIAHYALDIDHDAAWAHHAISHAQLLCGDIDQSIQFLEQHKASWHKVAPPLCTHNFWHLSLLYLANQAFEPADIIFNNHIWTDYPETNWQQIEGTSFLWRSEMAGQAQDQRWNAIATQFGQHPFHHDVPFNNIHFFYALTRNNQADIAREAIKQIRTDIPSLPKSAHHTWHDIAIPLFDGVVSFAEQDYRTACHHLSKAMQDIYAIGGSDAQVEIAIQTYYLSLLKSGNKTEANHIFQQYLSHYAGTNLAAYWSE